MGLVRGALGRGLRGNLAAGLVFVLMAAACGDDDRGEESVTTPSATTTVSAAPAPTTTVGAAPAATTTTSAMVGNAAAGTLDVELITDLAYHQGDERFRASSGLIDVVAPTTGGPWPVVVVFHGNPSAVSKEYHRGQAHLLAKRGRVVFLPAWGHTDSVWESEAGLRAMLDLHVREVTCAVVFTRARAAEFGGDPDHIILHGLSAGGNAVLTAGLARAEPLDACVEAGPAVVPQALVPVDADVMLGGGFDQQLSEDPEAFYSATPWRYLDGSHDFPIHVTVTAEPGAPYVRSVGSDPATSWLSYRHVDIDLVAELTELGFLDDGGFGLRESDEYLHQVLLDAGYDARLVILPGASHERYGDEGWAVLLDTILEAEQK